MDNPGLYVRKTKIGEICGGKIDFELTVRIINLWTTADRTNPEEVGAIHMILLDEGRDRIHATVRKELVPKFKDLIEEGSAYCFEKFLVAKNDASYRTTSHKYKLNFLRGTTVFKVRADEIPRQHFLFTPFQDILTKTADDQILDVIGHVVEKDDMKETEKNGKISKLMETTLEDLEGIRVHCSLWGDYAVQMHNFFATHDSSLPVVMIIQHCKTKQFLGTMRISNSFHGTKVLLNAQIPEVADYIDRMNAANVELTQGISQMSGPVVLSLADDLLQTQRMTIENLIEANEKCYGAVLVWACEIVSDSGWFYQACTKCASRISFMGGQLYCEKCKLPRTAIPRFKVNLQVMDNTGSITFVLFDRIVCQTLGRAAQALLDEMNNENGAHTYPDDLDVFIDKMILFKVEVTDANLYRNWRSYTVKKFTDDEDIIKQFATLHGIDLRGEDRDHSSPRYVCPAKDNSSLNPIDPGESSTNEDFVVVNALTTPTSKPVNKAGDEVEGSDPSVAKRSLTTNDDISLADASDVSTTKQIGKRPADSPVVDTSVVVPKGPRMVRGRSKATK